MATSLREKRNALSILIRMETSHVTQHSFDSYKDGDVTSSPRRTCVVHPYKNGNITCPFEREFDSYKDTIVVISFVSLLCYAVRWLLKSSRSGGRVRKRKFPR